MSYDLVKARRAIRAECTKQGIDDDSRRAMMQRLAGVTSSTELDADGARKVLDHLRKAAGQAANQARNEWSWVNSAAGEKRDFLWKIRRVCINLGIAPGQQVRYAEGVAARVFGCERRLQMMSAGELWKMIGPLERTARYKAAAGSAPAAGVTP